MPDTFILTINGKHERVHALPPTRTLLAYLRDAGRVGTKEGCGDGDCGACTVVMVAAGPDGRAQYQALNSCIVPIAALAGREIVTVEGIADGKPHPVQQAMIQSGGSQCGYCTPGFVMSMFSAYYDGSLGDAAIEGNLCRCTGYLPIRRAMASLGGPAADDPFLQRLSAHPTVGGSEGAGASKLAGRRPSEPYAHLEQTYYTPTTLAELLDIVAENEAATPVAGATDIGLEFSWHRGRFTALIGLEHVAELKTLSDTEAFVEIGAAVPLSHLEVNVGGVFPALDEMLRCFAARQIRNRATIGGNLATASPIGDLAPVLLALDATVKLASKSATRQLPVSELFTGYRRTALRAGEVIVSVTIPKQLAPGASERVSRSYKVTKRGSDDISTVAAAFTLDLAEGGSVLHARLAYGGVAPTPLRAYDAEAFLLGREWSEATMLSAKERLEEAFTPIRDVRGSAAYRRALTGNLFHRFFLDTQAAAPEAS